MCITATVCTVNRYNVHKVRIYAVVCGYVACGKWQAVCLKLNEFRTVIAEVDKVSLINYKVVNNKNYNNNTKNDNNNNCNKKIVNNNIA